MVVLFAQGVSVQGYLSQGVSVLRGKCPGGRCPEGICPWGKFPGGTCPGGLLSYTREVCLTVAGLTSYNFH